MLIEMGNFSVTLQRKKIKNINLRIKRTGEVQISAPIKTSIDTINSFLHYKRPWIETHRYRLLQIEQETHQKLAPGEYINFQGNSYEQQFHLTSKNQRIELSDKQLHFFIKPDASESYKELLLLKWYRTQMEKTLPSLFDKWQTIMNVRVNQISIKRMKSRWGSCQPAKKHITLNLRLIEKPLICLEYVIVHELVHLFEASHNQRFYALMSHFLPDWKQIKNQLS